MSSKTNHINLENYEEYLLLYVDNELTVAEKEMVDTFLLVHPELQIELDILMSTKLPAEPVAFDAKEDLMASQMKKDDIEESLLSYIDEEISEEEKFRIEKQVSADPLYANALTGLRKAKLDPNDHIAYPNKQELYRHTRKVISIRMWMQVAAAVVFVVFVSNLYLSESFSDEPSFTNNILPGTPKTAAVEPEPAVPLVSDENPSEQTVTVIEDQRAENQPAVALLPVEGTARKAIASHPKHIAVTTEEAPATVARRAIDIRPVAGGSIDAPEVNIKIDEPVVTSAITASYTYQEPGYTTSDIQEEKPRGSLKGFLRKATRIIEKNTGIGATNDDNELLIGALAVKL